MTTDLWRCGCGFTGNKPEETHCWDCGSERDHPWQEIEMNGQEAKAARDAALEQVSEGSADWMGNALQQIKALPKMAGALTGEDIRLRITNAIGPPHHHNVWGALISQAVKHKMLMPTGKLEPMKTKRSHARQTPTYWVCS